MKAVVQASRIRSYLREESGAGAAEFAMVALLMTAFMFGIIQMGSLLFIWNDMNNAAREGVREMAVDERYVIADETGTLFSCDGTGGTGLPPTQSAARVVCESLASWAVDFNVQADLEPVSLGATFACRELTVTISTDMGRAALFNIFGLLTGRQMQATATMVTEYVPGPGGGAPDEFGAANIAC